MKAVEQCFNKVLRVYNILILKLCGRTFTFSFENCSYFSGRVAIGFHFLNELFFEGNRSKLPFCQTLRKTNDLVATHFTQTIS